MLFGISFILFRNLRSVIGAFGTNLIMLCSYSEVPVLNLHVGRLLLIYAFLLDVCPESLLEAVYLYVVIGVNFASLEGLGLTNRICMCILVEYLFI